MSKVEEILERLTDWTKSPVFMHFIQWKANALLRKFASNEPGVVSETDGEFSRLMHDRASRHAAIAALVNGLAHEDGKVRMNAARVLGTTRLNGVTVSVAVPALMNALVDWDLEVRGQAARALKITGPEGGYGDLKILLNAARGAKKEKKPMDGFARAYSAWSEELNKEAERLVSDKRFHVPEVKKPDGTERILRVRRVGSHG